MLDFVEITRDRSLVKPSDTTGTNTAPVLTRSYFSFFLLKKTKTKNMISKWKTTVQISKSGAQQNQ